jgi:hypothetical protein
MSSSSPDAREPGGPRQRHIEAGVAIFMMLLGVIAIFGSLQVGIGWGAEGPKSGFFPFWIGLLIVVSSTWNLVRARTIPRSAQFAEWGQIVQVGKVVAPMIAYVVAIPWIGIYISSALLIGGFMRWLGRYGWVMTICMSVALPVVIYVTFEKWFLVPLPKGPIEDWLGL